MADDLNQSPGDGGAAGATDVAEPTDNLDTGQPIDQGDGGNQAADNNQVVEYTDFTFPEGIDIDQELLGNMTPKFQEMGLTQDQVQGLVSVFGEHVVNQQQSIYDQTSQQIVDWQTAAEADKEFRTVGLAVASASMVP